MSRIEDVLLAFRNTLMDIEGIEAENILIKYTGASTKVGKSRIYIGLNNIQEQGTGHRRNSMDSQISDTYSNSFLTDLDLDIEFDYGSPGTTTNWAYMVAPLIRQIFMTPKVRSEFKKKGIGYSIQPSMMDNSWVYSEKGRTSLRVSFQVTWVDSIEFLNETYATSVEVETITEN